ncbi:UNVERIFIED_CONTAM: Retrovirus-related Pol polyprotein from transposon [Sesamum calycinum]|uniref:Retrovirus-related Pol polyprotein from transposon n=1 Tax=Sesamum calycinum TaxID=2727403 RepID=A0AAW2P7K6_9LAMI
MLKKGVGRGKVINSVAQLIAGVAKYMLIKASGPIPGVVKKLLKVFEYMMPNELPQKLSPKRAIDHEIELIPGAKPHARALYRISEPELVELRKQLKEMLESALSSHLICCIEHRCYFRRRPMAPYVLHFLDEFVVVYLDDIVIYSGTLVEHVELPRQALMRLREHDLYAKVSKYSFAQETINFLGHIMERGHIWMDPKRAMVTDPVLALPNMSKPFVVETHASDYVLGGVPMQEGHPVAFESKKLKDIEWRYLVHEKELLVVVHCLRLWRHYLLGSPFVVKTNDTTVSHLMTQPKLTSKQPHW